MDTNMMLVIAGLVIAILVLLFLKQKSNQPKTKITTTKKNTGSEPTSAPVTSRPKIDIKRINSQIDELIATQQYAKAEGIINAHLNQNPDLTDLYDRLLQIYQLQHDEFAIKQLFETLQRLNLDRLYQLLTLKHDQYLTDQQALVAQPPIAHTSHAEQQPSLNDNSLSFENLNQHLEVASDTSPAHLSTSQHTTAVPILELEPHQAPTSLHTTAHVIDFVTSRQVDTVVNNPAIPQHSPVDVSLKASDEPIIDTPSATPSLKVDPVAPVTTTHTEPPSQVENSLTFDLSAIADRDNAPSETAAPTPALPPLDFNIDTAVSPAPAPVTKATTDNDFKLTLDVEQITSPPTQTSILAQAPALHFDTDEPSTLVFELNHPNLALQHSAPAAQPVAEHSSSSSALATPETVASSGLNFEAAEEADAIEATDTSALSEQHQQINDPILLAFPQLLDSDPAAVDLALAAYYIRLGQVEAALQLLNPYRADQQYADQVNHLMQQIA